MELASWKDFLDDIINVFLDWGAELVRQCHVVPAVAHALVKPHGDEAEPVLRRPIFAPSKLAPEGRPAEVQTVPKWSFDLRELEVFFPNDKFEVWRNNLEMLIAGGQTSLKVLESMLGRLNHTTFLIPLSHHFLNELILHLQSWCQPNWTFHLSREEKGDLILWLHFLEKVNEGFSINLLTVWMPTRVSWLVSCHS